MGAPSNLQTACSGLSGTRPLGRQFDGDVGSTRLKDFFFFFLILLIFIFRGNGIGESHFLLLTDQLSSFKEMLDPSPALPNTLSCLLS